MTNEASTPPVKRTVIVLDHSSKFLSLSKQHIDFDGGGKKEKEKVPAHLHLCSKVLGHAV